MRKVQGIILDLDGAFLDSNDARAQAWIEALREAGHPVPFEAVRALVGAVPHEILSRTVGFGEDTEEGRKIRDRARSIFARRYLSRIVPHFRAQDLYQLLEREGFRIAVASVDPHETLLPLLRILGAEGLIHRAAHPNAEATLITNREILKGAIDRLGVAPQRAMLIADAPHDIETAAKLGIGTIALASGGFAVASLRSAVAVYPDAAHLLASFERSPLAAIAA